MIPAIAKSKFGLILKNLSIATVLVLGLSQAAKAEKSNNQAELSVSCNPFISYNLDSGCSFDQEVAQINQNTTTQIAQTRRGRRRKSKVQGYYGGFSLGLGLPSGAAVDPDAEEEVDDSISPDYSSGFVGSLFGGIKFTKNLSSDLEFLLGLGGIDTDGLNDLINSNPQDFGIPEDVSVELDGDYSAFAFYINPRFELPVGKDNKFIVYASPGIGLSQTNVNINAEGTDGTDTGAAEEDSSTTGFTFQIKGGAQYRISDTTSILGQVRYANLPTDDDLEDIDLFSVETGLSFNF